MSKSFSSLAVTVFLITGFAISAQGQTTPAEQLEIKKQTLVNRLQMARTAGPLQDAALDPRDNIELYMLSLSLSRQSSAAIARETADLKKIIEATRVDKQLGSSSSASGSTSVTEKGAVPRVLAFAVENGALTRTQGGTTISFKANPAGIVKTLAGRPLPNGWSSRVAFGLEFDTSRGVAAGQPAVFSGDRQQLSGFNAKYEFLNHRDPASREFQVRVSELYARVGETSARNQKLLQLETRMVGQLTATGSPQQQAFNTWRSGALSEIQNAATTRALTEVLDRQLALLYESLSFPPIERLNLDEYLATYRTFLSSRDALLALAAKGAVMSLQYANSRPVDQPSESTLKWLYEWSAVNGKVDLTANASTTLLDGSLRDGSERWKAWAVSGQMDLPLGSIVQGRSLVFSFSGRAEGKIVLPTNDRQTIWLGQAKLTFPIKDAGVKMPLSVTVASRTDLIKETEVRGNIGLTFNLDSLIGM